MVKINLAGIPIEMNNQFLQLKRLCRGYETEKDAQITLSVSAEEIAQERSMQSDVFSDAYLETVCMYRKLALEVLQYNVFVLHASVIAVDGQGYAFLAPSGTGKTTQTRMWLDYFGDRACVVNGDKPLVRMVQKEHGWEFIAHGTPWCGKEGMNCNLGVPLRALFFLERAQEPSCRIASQEQTVERIFRQLLLPEDLEQMDRLLMLADHFVESVPCYILKCNMKPESVTTAYEMIVKQ